MISMKYFFFKLLAICRQNGKQECSGVKSTSGLERSASSGARKDEEDDDTAAIHARNKQENLEKSESNNYGISREDIQKHAGKRLLDVANIYGSEVIPPFFFPPLILI